MPVLCAAARPQAARCSGGARKQPQQVQQAASAPAPLRAQLLKSIGGAAAAAAVICAAPAHADFPGIESIELPSLDVSAAVVAQKAAAQSNLDAADAAFQNSGERRRRRRSRESVGWLAGSWLAAAGLPLRQTSPAALGAT